MNDLNKINTKINALIALVGVLAVIIIPYLGWIGIRIYSLSERVTRIETKLEYMEKGIQENQASIQENRGLIQENRRLLILLAKAVNRNSKAIQELGKFHGKKFSFSEIKPEEIEPEEYITELPDVEIEKGISRGNPGGSDCKVMFYFFYAQMCIAIIGVCIMGWLYYRAQLKTCS